MQIHPDKEPARRLVPRDQLRRAVLLGSATAVIVILGLLASYHTYQQDQSATGHGVRSNTLMSNQSPDPVVSAKIYRISSIYSRDSLTHTGKLPPASTDVAAFSLSQAIETFANEYSLTIDAVEKNYVSYITKDGLQINTQVNLAKIP